MSERQPSFSPNVDPDPGLRDQVMADIKNGKDVWTTPNFEPRSDMQDGLILYFYRGGGLVGYVEGNEQDGYYFYGPPYDEDTGRSARINLEPVETESEARKGLLDYLNNITL